MNTLGTSTTDMLAYVGELGLEPYDINFSERRPISLAALGELPYRSAILFRHRALTRARVVPRWGINPRHHMPNGHFTSFLRGLV